MGAVLGRWVYAGNSLLGLRMECASRIPFFRFSIVLIIANALAFCIPLGKEI